MTLGASGSINQKLNATKDELRETYVFDEVQGNVRLDSVADHRDVDGKLLLPGSLTVGFVLDRSPKLKEAGWMIGVDFSKQNWDDYRFYGLKDSVRNTWEMRIGTQLRPAPKKNYFSNVSYRAGFFVGDDYVRVGDKMSHYGISFGLGLPLASYRTAYASANQVTLINLAFEYGKRGNNSNLLRENTFRISAGFSLSDFWFSKRKYE